MDNEHLISLAANFAQIVAVAVATISIVAAAKSVRNQIQGASYNDFTSRFAVIADTLPQGLFSSNKDYSLDDLEEAQRQIFLSSIHKYFRLQSIQYHLNEIGGVHPKTWKMWRASATVLFSKAAVRTAWQEFSNDFSYNPKFQSYVEQVIIPRARQHSFNR